MHKALERWNTESFFSKWIVKLIPHQRYLQLPRQHCSCTLAPLPALTASKHPWCTPRPSVQYSKGRLLLAFLLVHRNQMLLYMVNIQIPKDLLSLDLQEFEGSLALLPSVPADTLSQHPSLIQCPPL